MNVAKDNSLHNSNSTWFAESGMYTSIKPKILKNKAQQLLSLSETTKNSSIKDLQDEFERLSRNAAIEQRRSIVMTIDNKPSAIVEYFMEWLRSEGFTTVLEGCSPAFTGTTLRKECSVHIIW